MFDQPELESLLRANLRWHPVATIRGNTEVTRLAQDGTGLVRVECTDQVDGGHHSILAHYVLGCDGANSMTRNSIGATMQDLRFEQRWLVADVATETDLGQWEGVQQVCDPHRAATYMRVSPTHHRWEFRLLPGETADDYRQIERLHRLLAPWTGRIGVDQLQIMRVAEYTFRAQVADRWRDRQVFLLGDAAHLTPPFIGQGMGAGMRDAMNLAWKLAGVLRGDLPGSVLETYQAERKPHVRTMIRRAKLMGIAMTAGGEAGSLVRRVVAPRLQHLSGLRLPIWDSATETPPLGRSDLAVRPPLRRTLAGRLCPNARLDDGRRFDDVAAGRFTVVTSTDPSAAQRTHVDQRGGVLVVTRPGSELDRWLRRGRSTAAIVRPDATVLRAGRDLSALCAALPASSARRAAPVSTLR
jgi:3-(3-hydroxy-phenyl)propionate hydroxylase